MLHVAANQSGGRFCIFGFASKYMYMALHIKYGFPSKYMYMYMVLLCSTVTFSLVFCINKSKFSHIRLWIWGDNTSNTTW